VTDGAGACLMEIINAIWDEKITGLKTCEILFDKGDSFETYLIAGPEKEFRLLVAKVPVNDLKLVHQLEDSGYRYLENQIKLSFEVNQLGQIDPKWKRLLKGFSCGLVTTDGEIGEIESEVSDNMFESDRYTLDPFWRSGISSARYTNWIRDLYGKEDVRFYEIRHNNEKAGFFVMQKESPGVNRCPLAGIYNRYKGAGYIFVLTWFWLEISRREGNTRVFTSVSSNNRVMLSSLSKAFSFRLCDTLIVLRKVNV
jgi:hypothetical protein